MRWICAALPLLVLAGCSSYKAAPERVTQVPDERLLAYQQPVDNSGHIVVNRDIGMLGGGCYLSVLIDRQVAARIGIGEEAVFNVPAGSHMLGIGLDQQDDTLCSKGRLHYEFTLQLKAGESQHFRIVSESSHGFAIEPEASRN